MPLQASCRLLLEHRTHELSYTTQEYLIIRESQDLDIESRLKSGTSPVGVAPPPKWAPAVPAPHVFDCCREPCSNAHSRLGTSLHQNQMRVFG